jgi:effector-binding domain-containing protein
MTPESLNIRSETYPAFQGLGIQRTAKIEDLANIMGPLFNQVNAQVQAEGLMPEAGFTLTVTYDGPTNSLTFISGMITSSLGVGAGEIVVVNEPAKQSLVADYFGGFDGLAAVYGVISQWAKTNNVVLGESAIELYLSDPGKVATPADNHTRIVWPIA